MSKSACRTDRYRDRRQMSEKHATKIIKLWDREDDIDIDEMIDIYTKGDLGHTEETGISLLWQVSKRDVYSGPARREGGFHCLY